MIDKREIRRGNRVIADYMGIDVVDENDCTHDFENPLTDSDLHYHESWDALIPVLCACLKDERSYQWQVLRDSTLYRGIDIVYRNITKCIMHTCFYDLVDVSAGESISHGTFDNYDLITTFLEVLKNTHHYAPLIAELPTIALNDHRHKYWDSEDATYLLNEQILNIMCEYAPPGYYFGSHPGNGSDYGYWEVDDEWK